MGFDLKAAKASHRDDDGIVVQLEHRNGDPATYTDGDVEKPVTVRIAGTYSKVYRKTVDQQTQRLIRAGRAKPTPEQIQANRTELVAASILAWDGVVNDGRPFPLSKENAVALLDAAPWVRDQLEGAQGDAASFSGASSTS